MKSSLYIGGLVGLALVGCCPCKHLATGTTDSTRVEIRERIVKVRDTVVVELPAERVEVITPDTTSTVQTSLATSTAIVSGGVLTHSIENKKTAIRKPTEVRVEVRDSIIYRDRQTTKVVEVERELTAWQRFRLDGFWVLLSVVLLSVVLKLKTLKII
jgi:nucleoid-associated protein YgaU